ncbi:UMP kinase [Chitinivibrio alkaliphilus]|uniref:Uridylate kinase n=1 Tax=Chitinivibrio alkaliphilus ACht1 TaxID=1313304 RepID=U7D4Q4_9BACT|nr:UMP kinase [Chitinivibrio alkaliphilus]ERP30918.1 uridylate kinase [Chitinivibrio alkaliphilus ACht1]
MSDTHRYGRILLKLSGEALAGDNATGISPEELSFICTEISDIHNAGVAVGIVVGGGNIFRGVAGEDQGVRRTTGDTVGMLSTMINSFMIQDCLERRGVPAVVLSAVQADKIAELFTVQRAESYLSQNTVVIIGGGTGNPFFTTDSAAALRCAELGCDALFKATKVDGIYDKDPVRFPDAQKIPELTHQEALEKNLQVMDVSAFSICRDNSIPILVFKMMEKRNLLRAVTGESIGSLVRKGV